MSEPGRAGAGNRRRWFALAGALALGGWFIATVAPEVTALRAYVVPTGSMSPAIRPGDRVLASHRASLTPRRGEVWIVRLPNSPAGNLAIKRVIGLPGETISVSGGKVLIDGRSLDEPDLKAPIRYSLAPTRLGRDEYFVLGDNRNASHDSHVWGPALRSAMLGRVTLRVWPPQRVGGP